MSKPEMPDVSYAQLTYDGDRIVQVDIYVPEVLPDEVVIGVDLKEFTEKYPLVGGITINQEVAEADDDGFTVSQVSRQSDMLTIADDLEPSDLSERADGLVINQHIGKLCSGGIVVGVSTYDMKVAARDAFDYVKQMRMFEDALGDYSSN